MNGWMDGWMDVKLCMALKRSSFKYSTSLSTMHQPSATLCHHHVQNPKRGREKGVSTVSVNSYVFQQCCGNCCPYDSNPLMTNKTSDCLGFAYNDRFGCSQFTDVLNRGLPLPGLQADCKESLRLKGQRSV